VPRSTLYFQRHQRTIPLEERPDLRKRGLLGACPDEEPLGHIRRILSELPFHGEGYRKVWARLRFQGIRTSKERVRRLMRQHGLQAPQRVGHPHGPKAHDRTILTERPDELWGTDMTTTVTTEESQVCVFVAVDHCTAECIGIHAAKSGNRFEGLEPLRQGVREHFGGFERGIAAGLAIRHDHGSAYMSDDFQQELAFLGMTSSPSFVREPEGNGVAERFIRTLKENWLWVHHFATVAELIEALRQFQRRYNEQWLIERQGYRSPAQVRRDLTAPIPAIA
jgi:transposase InsO family protein